ncbi:unnamed protein product [Phytophthora fragariaefolia]|uniref:Unnamed protein product n=1 Tax=Phytophthora fragariaefolia TaxID=1490495 RepID=A0A9W6XSS7_9STRA|nr:unnamed protein product [Phytophthora fragariaefolia]
MAESQDKPKEHADARGRNNLASYSVGELVLFNAKTLPTEAGSVVFKTKLHLRYIGPFKVVVKKGLGYMLNLPKKMRTHPVFYVGLLKPYEDPARVPMEAPQQRARGAHSASPTPTSVVQQALGPDAQPLSATVSSLAQLVLQSGSLQMRSRPPPALLGEQGSLHYHVECILAKSRCRGHNQYLVKWRGYPNSENSWVFEVPLRQDCPDVVAAFDRKDQQRQRACGRPVDRLILPGNKLGGSWVRSRAQALAYTCNSS